MNEYRHRLSGKIVNEDELRRAFPNEALPQVLDAATLEPRGYDAVLANPPPEVSASQQVLRDGAILDTRGNWVQAWRVEDLPAALIAERAAAAAMAARQTAKATRADKVARIVVEVDGLSFDGDEDSQGRMARAILALESAGVANTPWTLANNTIVFVTAGQLRMALVKAGLAQTAVWAL